jgi:hypothetical protein
MTRSPARSDRPTHRQLRYLKTLAERTGQTFVYPRTIADARTEIDRLKATRPESQLERTIERKHIADQIADGPNDAARVRRSEITGYGSTATWKDRS